MSLSGVPVVYMSIVRNLSKEYFFDIVIFKNNDMFFEKEFLSFGGKIFFFDCPIPNGVFGKINWLLFKYGKEAKKFIKDNIDLSQYSAIHSFNELYSFPFLKAGKDSGIKNLIVHICSPMSAYPDKGFRVTRFMAKQYQKKAFKLCSSIVCVSEQTKKYYNYNNKGVVVYNMYDENKFSSIVNCNHNNLVLTQIGTFSSRKNQLFSLEVIDKIKQLIPNVKLNIVGKEIEPDYKEKMDSMMQEHNLIDNVVYISNSTNRGDIDKDTSYYIYPSTFESFGMILIESQAAGIHCFASDTIPNDADMGNASFLPLDSDIWATEIVKYYNEFGNKRKEPLNKEKFSKSNFIKSIKKLYN